EQATGTPRTRLLARFSAGGQAGALIGPVLGALLLVGGVRAACLAGAAVFALVLAGHWRLMPHREPGAHRAPGTEGRPPVRELLRHRRFLALAFAYSTYLLAYNQLYLMLPAELQRATGSQAALGWLFALSSVLVVAGQLPLERWAGARLSWGASARTGLALIAGSFAAAGVLQAVGGLWASGVFVVLLTLGQMLVVPATRAWL
ncbi:MFS transporter, partial [Streptomyces sp. T-3]|nr:MFS transporter [Streptomyces sp. T-3]